MSVAKRSTSWAYAATYQKPISVPQTLILQLTRFGMDVVLAHPPEYKLMPDIVQQARDNAKKHGGGFEMSHDWTTPSKTPISSIRSLGERCSPPTTTPRARGSANSTPVGSPTSADGARARGRYLYALPAGRPQRGGCRRGARRPAVRSVRQGRESPARSESRDGAHDALKLSRYPAR